MDEGLIERVRESLVAKRQTLETWLEDVDDAQLDEALGDAGSSGIDHHLAVIDSSLDKADDGTLGMCIECHEPVEPDLLQMDYTRCVCLTHLSAAEQRSLESEIELAATVQRSLLPQEIPVIANVDVAAFSRPAQYVGGDYFDFFPFADGRQGLVIADVAGHGMSSSLIMASLQAMIRTISLDTAHPAALVSRINHLCLHNIQFTTFISLFLAAYEPTTRELVYCNAGHNPPILMRGKSGTREWLKSTGPAIGLSEDAAYQEHSVSGAPGDLFYMYTDGVTENASPDGDLFGTERLEQVLAANNDRQAQDVLQGVRAALDAFADGRAPEDDITMVAWKFTQGS